jgi:CspA family cold shock protein
MRKILSLITILSLGVIMVSAKVLPVKPIEKKIERNKKVVVFALRGKVNWFNDSKGFGFITPDVGGPDIFFSYRNIVLNGFKSVQAGAIVSYEIYKSQKGDEAILVTPL